MTSEDDWLHTTDHRRKYLGKEINIYKVMSDTVKTFKFSSDFIKNILTFSKFQATANHEASE